MGTSYSFLCIMLYLIKYREKSSFIVQYNSHPPSQYGLGADVPLLTTCGNPPLASREAF